MTIFEVLQEYTSNKDKYSGFKRNIDNGVGFTINKNGDIVSDSYHSDVTIDTLLTKWHRMTDWVLIEKEIIPEGYHKNANGEIVKPCICEVWINVYKTPYSHKLFESIHDSKESADVELNDSNRFTAKHVFIKQLHLSQQYSVPYIKEK